MMKYYFLSFLIGISTCLATNNDGVDYSVDVPIQYMEEPPIIIEESSQEKIEEPTGSFVDKVVLGALDKVTARVSRLVVKVNEPVKFGTLTIMVKKCWKASPEDIPETKALLEITEKKPSKPLVNVFRDWMFASNRSVITLEHPVFDVWVTHDLPDAPIGVQPINDAASQKLEQLLDKLRELPED
jgi:hypothetical protein